MLIIHLLIGITAAIWITKLDGEIDVLPFIFAVALGPLSLFGVAHRKWGLAGVAWLLLIAIMGIVGTFE